MVAIDVVVVVVVVVLVGHSRESWVQQCANVSA
jgi:hypothetical protein